MFLKKINRYIIMRFCKIILFGFINCKFMIYCEYVVCQAIDLFKNNINKQLRNSVCS